MKNRTQFAHQWHIQWNEGEDEIGNNNHKNKAFPSHFFLLRCGSCDAVRVQRAAKKIKMNYLLVMNCHCG